MKLIGVKFYPTTTDDRKKARLFSSDGIMHRRIVRKRKQTLEKEAEDKGWMLLR